MQQSLTSPQGFHLKRKYTNRDYKSMNVRNKSSQHVRKSAHLNSTVNQHQQKLPSQSTYNYNTEHVNLKKQSSLHINIIRQSETNNQSEININVKTKSLTQHHDLLQHNVTLNKSTSEQSQKLSRHYLVSRQSKQSKQSKLKNYRYRRLNFSSHKDQPISKLSIGSINGINSNGNVNNSIFDFKRKTERENIFSKLKTNMNTPLLIFLNKVQQFQLDFITFALNQNYQQSAEVIVSLLNYTVDLNLVDQFSITLKILADFYLLCGKVNQALFYYNQTRQSALLLSQSTLLIESLIGIAKCCSKGNLEKQGISILKKALQYAWYYEKRQLQLQLYDEIGQKYYHLGDLSRAKKYHLRYINSIYEPSDSAHKSLSIQRIKKVQQINIEIKYNDLSILFLVHLKIPIRSCKQIPSILGDTIKSASLNQNNIINLQSEDEVNNNHQLSVNSNLNMNNVFDSGMKMSRNINVRDQFNINKKYFSHFQDMQSWMKTIMKTWFFAEEMDEPLLSNDDWTAPLKLKKFAYIDFKLNQHLKKFTNTSSNKNMKQKQGNKNNKSIEYKQSLDEKIERKLKQPVIDSQWYEKMVQQIVRDHKNKLLNVRDAIRMRGYNKQTKPVIQSLKQIYNKFFEKKTQSTQLQYQNSRASHHHNSMNFNGNLGSLVVE